MPGGSRKRRRRARRLFKGKDTTPRHAMADHRRLPLHRLRPFFKLFLSKNPSFRGLVSAPLRSSPRRWRYFRSSASRSLSFIAFLLLFLHASSDQRRFVSRGEGARDRVVGISPSRFLVVERSEVVDSGYARGGGMGRARTRTRRIVSGLSFVSTRR